MDVAPPPAPPAPPAAGPPGAPATPPIVTGTAATIADRLGIDALWVRVAFVVLALVGGLGVPVYLGAWLALVAGDRVTNLGRAARVAGGLLLVVGFPLFLHGGSFDLLTGPWAVVLLLAGLTLALWSPRRTATPIGWAPPIPPPDGGAPTTSPAADRVRPVPAPRPPREPSYLGQTALGLAIVTAATGGLIDTLNGGRAHPEQWLGAAAAVCGLGLVVGAVRGRARWLVVPAAGFAVAGYLTGVAADIGVPWSELTDDAYVAIGTDGSLSSPARAAFGDVWIEAYQAPTEPATIEVEVGYGDVHISRSEDITVAVDVDGDQRVEAFTLDPDGVEQRDVTRGPVTIGDGAVDVTIHATIGQGTVRVTTFVPAPMPVPPVTTPGGIPPIELPTAGALVPIGASPGVAGTTDGWLMLGDNEALIGPDDELEYSVQGTYVDERGLTRIPTAYGDYVLLPRQLLMTPDGQILDLVALRDELAATGATTTVPAGATDPPVTTALDPTGTT